MMIRKQTHLDDHLEGSREVVERLFNENMENKLDSYLKKFERKDDAEGNVELSLNKGKEGFDGKLQINLDGKPFRYSREGYHNLDDLINHLFKHFKEELSHK